MKVSLTGESAQQIDADALVLGCFQNEPLAGAASIVDEATRGVLSRLVEAEEITGKHAELTTLLAPAGVKAGRVLIVGLGERDDWGQGEAFRAVSAAAKQLAVKSRDRVAFCLGQDWNAAEVESGVCASLVGCYGQDLYREKKKLHPFGEVLWATSDEASCTSGKILAESVNLTRELVNRPASDIYPESLAARAEEMAAECGLGIEIWGAEQLAEQRCGSLLGVAQGSSRPPRLVILSHQGGDSEQAPLALVGKGVTFDSGGLSLKPSESMQDMKCDMAGAATVVGAMQAIARLQLPVNVLGFAGLVENMVSGSSYKLGDVLTARSGKTIEVLNTDAEGRLVLADVLDVAIERGAARIVDLATLTGACMVALGTDVAGLMTNDQDWCDRVAAAAKVCGESAWQLPMFAEYGEQIQSKVADIKNIGEGRWGGAITAAKFLEEFVQDTPWVHIDIAGPAFLDSAKPWLDAGGSGAFVRTLVELARSLNE